MSYRKRRDYFGDHGWNSQRRRNYLALLLILPDIQFVFHLVRWINGEDTSLVGKGLTIVLGAICIGGLLMIWRDRPVHRHTEQPG